MKLMRDIFGVSKVLFISTPNSRMKAEDPTPAKRAPKHHLTQHPTHKSEEIQTPVGAIQEVKSKLNEVLNDKFHRGIQGAIINIYETLRNNREISHVRGKSDIFHLLRCDGGADPRHTCHGRSWGRGGGSVCGDYCSKRERHGGGRAGDHS